MTSKAKATPSARLARALPLSVLSVLSLSLSLSLAAPAPSWAQTRPNDGIRDNLNLPYEDQAAGEATTGPTSGAGTSVSVPRGSVTVRPGGEAYVSPDLRVALVGATETGGDVASARRGLAAAYAAISVLPGYTNIAPTEVASAMNTRRAKRDALRVPEYELLRTRVRADRTLSVTLRPGDISDASASYTAVVELTDTVSGGLAGRGEGTFTATADATDIATDAPENAAGITVPSANLARGVRVGAAATARERAVDGAVARAVFDLNRPMLVRGVVLHKIARADGRGAPYHARISLGEMSGARVGTPVQYLSAQGDTLGYGTIVDMAAGESLATVAPEAAYANLYINCEVRTLDNPPLARAGRTAGTRDEKEWSRFERQFGTALAVASLIYLATK
jgi:hypothetical protein